MDTVQYRQPDGSTLKSIVCDETRGGESAPQDQRGEQRITQERSAVEGEGQVRWPG